MAAMEPPPEPVERPPPEPVTIEYEHSPNINKLQNYTLNLPPHAVQVTVTSTPSVVRKWVEGIVRRNRFRRNRLVVGLGVQWSSGHSEFAATLQLCVGQRCLIFQLQHADRCPIVLRRFLVDPSIILVGFANYRDGDMLGNTRHNLIAQRMVDLREVAVASRGCRPDASINALAAEILGLRRIAMDVQVSMGDWSLQRLSAEQVKYATLDAFLAFLVGIKLQVWNMQGAD